MRAIVYSIGTERAPKQRFSLLRRGETASPCLGELGHLDAQRQTGGNGDEEKDDGGVVGLRAALLGPASLYGAQIQREDKEWEQQVPRETEGRGEGGECSAVVSALGKCLSSPLCLLPGRRHAPVPLPDALCAAHAADELAVKRRDGNADGHLQPGPCHARRAEDAVPADEMVLPRLVVQIPHDAGANGEERKHEQQIE